MTFTTNMVALARRLTSKFGESVTFTRTTQGAYQPATGDTAAPSITNYTANVVTQDYSEFERNLESIQQDDVKLCVETLATNPVEPLVGDTCVIDSLTYKIIRVDKMTSTGTDVLYILQARV